MPKISISDLFFFTSLEYFIQQEKKEYSSVIIVGAIKHHKAIGKTSYIPIFLLFCAIKSPQPF